MIRTERLTKQYLHKNGEVYALKDISLEIKKLIQGEKDWRYL